MNAFASGTPVGDRAQMRLLQRRLLVLRRELHRLQVQPVRREEELVQDRRQQRVLALGDLLLDALPVLRPHLAGQKASCLAWLSLITLRSSSPS